MRFHPGTGLGAAASALLLACAGLGACATNPVTGGTDFVTMSEQDEIELGEQYHPQVVQQFGIYRDPELQSYVNEIGQRLAGLSHRSHLKYHFTVLDDDTVNAFTTPGGYIYISRGLMAHMNSEAELAAVLGHEVGHVTARHFVRRESQSSVLGALGQLVGVATNTRAAADLTNLAGGAVIMGHSRKFELEADGLGAEYLARAGYDPEAMIEVIEILKHTEQFEIERAKREGRDPKVYHGFFASHPDNDTRLREVIDAAKTLETEGEEIVNAEPFLRQLDGVSYGKGAGGVVRDSRFYHPGLRIKLTLPDDWRSEVRPEQLLATSPDNDAILQVRGLAIDRNISPRNVMAHHLHLTKLRDGTEITVDGLPAYIAVAERAESPFGPRPVRYAVIVHPDRGLAYVIAGAGRDDLHTIAADRDFIATIFSLEEMEPRDYRHARPLQLRLIRTGSDTTIENLAAQSAISPYASEQLRLLNGLYPDGEPEAGQLIKIVQ